jgi:hypothetical protein
MSFTHVANLDATPQCHLDIERPFLPLGFGWVARCGHKALPATTRHGEWQGPAPFYQDLFLLAA